MNLIVDLSLFCILVLNTLLHAIGAYFLLKLYRDGKGTTQRIYFLNLSIAEVFLNLMEVLDRIPEMMSHTDEDISQIKINKNQTEHCIEDTKSDNHITKITEDMYELCQKIILHEMHSNSEYSSVLLYIQHYATLLYLTGLWLVLYLTMTYVTLDRLLMVKLAFRYKTYWTLKKSRYLVYTTWVVCMMVPFGIAIGELFYKFHYQDVIYEYLFPTLDFIYISFATTTYTYIFIRFIKSSQMSHKVSGTTIQSRRRRRSSALLFKDSKFYTTILLVLTFLVFIVVPNLIYLMLGMHREHTEHLETLSAFMHNKDNIVFDLCRFSYAIASCLHFFIYIFVLPEVKLFFHNTTPRLPCMLRSCFKRRALERTDLRQMNALGHGTTNDARQRKMNCVQTETKRNRMRLGSNEVESML